MSISIHPTLLGRLAGLLYQQRPIYMSVMFGGGGRRYRVIPAMTEHPFLISPIIETNDDILNLLTKRPGQRVEEVMLERRRAGSWQYDDLIRVKLYTAPGFPHSAELLGPDEILRMKTGSSGRSQP